MSFVPALSILFTTQDLPGDCNADKRSSNFFDGNYLCFFYLLSGSRSMGKGDLLKPGPRVRGNIVLYICAVL